MWGKTETGLTKAGEPGTVALNISPSGLGTPVQTLREAEAKMGFESWEIYWRKASEGWKAAGRTDGRAGRPWSGSNLWKEGGKKNLERKSLGIRKVLRNICQADGECPSQSHRCQEFGVRQDGPAVMSHWPPRGAGLGAHGSKVLAPSGDIDLIFRFQKAFERRMNSSDQQVKWINRELYHA